MSRMSLHQFVARVLADDRILFGDLKRLQRDVLPARITTREEAELLLFLDSAVRRTDREWSDYLTSTVRDFAIWGLHPAGSLDRPKAAWIASALACTDPTRTARAIVREIVHEARNIDAEALAELGIGGRKSHPVTARERSRRRHCESGEFPLPDGRLEQPREDAAVRPRS